jgi:hypothetical protein
LGTDPKTTFNQFDFVKKTSFGSSVCDFKSNKSNSPPYFSSSSSVWSNKSGNKVFQVVKPEKKQSRWQFLDEELLQEDVKKFFKKNASRNTIAVQAPREDQLIRKHLRYSFIDFLKKLRLEGSDDEKHVEKQTFKTVMEPKM